MIALPHRKGQRIAVLGLGRSGLSAARALKASGAQPVAWDDSEAARAAAAAEGIAIEELAPQDPGRFSALILSPGIPRRRPRPHPAVARWLTAGAPILGDIDLLAEAAPDARFLGITGTNGKSTTTALVGHILRQAGLSPAVGGNLGTPALELGPVGPGGWYVLELSSYQLETVSRVAWDACVLLNVTPDHLDRYDGMADYVAAKRRLFDRARDGATAIIGLDDGHGAATRARAAGRLRTVGISGSRRDGIDVSGAGGRLVADGVELMDLSGVPTLPGAHNWQNAAAAYAAARAAGVGPAAIAASIRSFPGLAHRQELVATAGRVRFVNDSKATNPDAAAKALASYPRIHWIAGGKPKDGALDALLPHLGSVAHAYLIGDGASLFAAFLDGRVPASRCGDLATATAEAFAAASRDGHPAPVVLLSPACASFDQFRNFEHRGEVFAGLARSLAARPASAEAMTA